MKACSLCKQNTSFEKTTCAVCGYEFESKKICNSEVCKKYYQQLRSKRGNWVETIEFLGRLQELTRLSNVDIGRLLELSRSTICQDIQLSNGIKDKPELKNITSKSKAFKTFNEAYSIKTFDNEETLHRNLYENWNTTPFAEKWKLVRTGSYYGKFDTHEIGEMDMLARNKFGNKWLVIELKKGPGSDDTVGQVLRYMGWVKKHKAEENDTIEGLVLCGEYNLQMDYALKCIPFIEAKIYRFQNNEFNFLPFAEHAHVSDILNSLEPEQLKKVMEKLNFIA